MPKRELIKRIDQRAAGAGSGGGGGGASSNADTVDGLHASRIPTPGYLLALGDDAQFPASVVAVGDLDGVTIDGPTDNEVLAYDETTGQWINQTADEANLQEKLTTGDLTASAPLQVSATRQVIGGDAALSLDQAGIDHGSIGGLGDDDHTQYLLANGSRAGATSQAQSFGANGIAADQIAEATSGSGVTVDGVLLKDGGATFAADVDFASFMAVAMSCDRGTGFPTSPAQGQWFYHTTSNCLFMYDGSVWKPIISFGAMTLYVDGTNGSDAPGQGFASGSGATATIQYAINLIPAIVGGNVTINVAAGTYAVFTVPKKLFLGSFTIELRGATTVLESGTMSHVLRHFKTAGAGQVNTPSGGSTTITLSGGGSTSVFAVGSFITANNITRRVVSITDSTTFTVDASVDWYNGGAGYSWTYSSAAFRDTTKSWSDDQFNNKIVQTDTSYYISYGVIEDTVASNSLIVLGAGILPTYKKNYQILQLDTVISGSDTIYIYSDYFRMINIKSEKNVLIRQANFVQIIGCQMYNAKAVFNGQCFYSNVYGAHF